MAISKQQIPVEAGKLPLTVAAAGGVGAVVVIMPSAFGVGPDLEAQMEELARDASAVVALDPFFREDAGPVPYEDRGRAIGRLQALDKPRGYRDLRAAIDWARARNSGQAIVLLGICFGGPYALMAAADGVADAVVTWHGTRMDQYVERAAEMRCTMRLHFGSEDPVTPPEAVAAVRRAFAERPDVRVVVHEGAGHGYSQRASAHAYHEAAERAGMYAVQELVALKAGPLSMSQR